MTMQPSETSRGRRYACGGGGGGGRGVNEFRQLIAMNHFYTCTAELYNNCHVYTYMIICMYIHIYTCMLRDINPLVTPGSAREVWYHRRNGLTLHPSEQCVSVLVQPVTVCVFRVAGFHPTYDRIVAVPTLHYNYI